MLDSDSYVPVNYICTFPAAAEASAARRTDDTRMAVLNIKCDVAPTVAALQSSLPVEYEPERLLPDI